MEKKKILIIENYETIKKEELNLPLLLKHQGYFVKYANGSLSLLNEIKKSAYDFILIEKELKDTNGIVIAKIIKKYHPNIKIILMSNNPSWDELAEIKKMDLPHIEKPFSIEELLALLEK